jgi:glycosyltransferase involved in cell wall biosynthesis
MSLDFTQGVSVCLFTFNYGKYLGEAIDSVLSQKTSFPVEIVIGDDHSTDNTRSIAEEYEKRNPGRILLSFSPINLGGTRNWIRTMNACRGKYIALLDGDDYFTDPYKLQRQYDMLEANTQYVMCVHSVEERIEGPGETSKVVGYAEKEFTLGDIFRRGWFIRTAATFFRNGIIPAEPPAWVHDFPYRYDTIIHVFLNQHGKTVNIPQVMSVWRKHPQGMSRQLLQDRFRNVQMEIALSERLNAHCQGEYRKESKAFIRQKYAELFFPMAKSFAFFRQPRLFWQCVTNMDYGYVLNMIKGRVHGA